MAIDKSKWNAKIKVSQKTIDAIKKQGMSASLKKAATSSDASFVEGVKRIYGAGRVSSAGTVARNTNARESRASKKITGSASVSKRTRSAEPVMNQRTLGQLNRGIVAAKPKAPRASGRLDKYVTAPKPAVKSGRMAANEELSRMITAKARAAAVSKTSPNNANKRESRPTTVASAPVPRGTFPKTFADMNANKRESRLAKTAAPRKVAASQTRSYTGYPGKSTPSRRSW